MKLFKLTAVALLFVSMTVLADNENNNSGSNESSGSNPSLSNTYSNTLTGTNNNTLTGTNTNTLTGTNTNTNSLENSNSLRNSNSLENSNESKNTNTNTTTNTSTSSGGNGGNGGSGGSVNISTPRHASTAYAGTVYPTAMCMGSSSGGVQSTLFGFSAASSWTDKNCMVLEQARSAATVLGDKTVAEEIMCGLKEYREARNRIGNPCVADKK